MEIVHILAIREGLSSFLAGTRITKFIREIGLAILLIRMCSDAEDGTLQLLKKAAAFFSGWSIWQA
ncbi:hypothetical protein SAMN02745166_02374 [Prosthecobacter debontii]|uniref:Uncharacterized protein n=1 Tax=Prosthecobacter debontii TaxID=48467 RepID=A0A1T4Y377_9BACT|nr:hypothetical protein [Prosthecobacter debontii]SKA96274.1 hypothetical protein SAMN02745166_02374 [Prosthecobacter debontii]